jgi:hypothetical protein
MAFPLFYKVGGLLRSSNNPRTGHYLEHVESSFNSSMSLLLNPLYYYSLIPYYILSTLFLLVFPVKTLSLHFLLPIYVLLSRPPYPPLVHFTLSLSESSDLLLCRLIRFFHNWYASKFSLFV